MDYSASPANTATHKPDLPPPMSKGQAADFFGVCPKTIDNWTKLHGLPCVRMGGPIRQRSYYQLDQLQAWLRQRAASSVATTTEGGGA